MEIFTQRDPLYHVYRHFRGRVLCIEGIISSGKTTLGKHMEQFFNKIGIPCKFFPEYVNPILLSQFIENMKHYAYSFQMIMLCKRIDIYRQVLEFSKQGGFSIVDRSLVGDSIFATMQHHNGNISDNEFAIYKQMIQHEIMIEPDHILYLDCSVDTSIERIQKRGNTSEIEGYSPQYLQSLLDFYKAEIQHHRHISLDWNHSLDWSNPDPIIQDILHLLS